jgi:hypothetical protein
VPNIQTPVPPITLAVGDQQYLAIPVTLPSGATFTDFPVLTLTLRQDPWFVRQTASAVQQTLYADPSAEGWPIAFQGTGTGTTVGGVSTATFLIPSSVGLTSGTNAYTCAVWGSGGDLGPVQLLQESWVTVLPG